MSFKKPDEFVISNALEGNVGTLVGDGIELQFNANITSVSICLNGRKDITADDTTFTIPDFASR